MQGDEVNYLDMARQVLVQPLTPLNFQYVFQGRLVSAAGHPHPPLNAYLLALPWLVRGHFSVGFFHAWYLLFALAISFAAYALATRFTPQPLWAALLLAASPIVQVNTNTVAGPEPAALAFLLIGAAAFFWRRFWISGVAFALAGLTEIQALALPPILLLEYAVKRRRPPRAAWLVAAAPFLAFAGWQIEQWFLMRRLPGAVLLGYVQGSGLSRLSLKGASALALLEHLGVLVTLVPLARRRLWGIAAGLLAALLVRGYPWWERALLLVFIALGVNALLWLWNARRRDPVLAGWCLLYFAFAAVAFFAGAARYLLPLVAPMVVLFVLEFQDRRGWLALALAFNVLLGLNVSFAAYEFARAYTTISPPPGRTFLVNGEWGFRYYMERQGGRMLESGSVPVPGEWIVASPLSLAGNYDTLAEETAVPVRSSDIRVRTPLRLVDRYAHSGFSSVSFGLLSFSFSTRPLDQIEYSRTSSFLNLPAPWTPTRLSGHLVYVPASNTPIRLPLGFDEPRLQFGLFASGQGQARFLIRDAAGRALVDQTTQVNGSLWDVHVLPLKSPEAALSIDAPQSMKAGWGDLVLLDGGPASPTPQHAPEPAFTFLNMGDVRTRPQLLSGFYGIEDGAWRWIATQAEVVLRAPSGVPAALEIQLYFPPEASQAPFKLVTVSVDMNGSSIGTETYAQPGGYRFAKPVPAGLLRSNAARVSIHLSRPRLPDGSDQRELGAVVQRLGFVGGS